MRTDKSLLIGGGTVLYLGGGTGGGGGARRCARSAWDFFFPTNILIFMIHERPRSTNVRKEPAVAAARCFSANSSTYEVIFIHSHFIIVKKNG